MNTPKPRIPDGMAGVVDRARERHYDRFCPPRIWIKRAEGGGWQFSCPYSEDESERWSVLLFDALGTRDPAVADYFLGALTKLCPGDWDEEQRAYTPRENDFNAVLAIVGSMRPENEAQAAHAAQLAALHLSAMKLSEQALEWGDARTAAILNKTVRAFGEGLERLARLQGKIAPRAIHQTFEVHKHVHFEGGAAPTCDQPYGAEPSERGARAALIEASPAMPGEKPGGEVVRLPCREGQAGLPSAWWGARLWRSLWRA